MPDSPEFPAYSQILLKQFSYFKTVIVTADVHWCFTQSAPLRSLLRKELRRGKPSKIRKLVLRSFCEAKSEVGPPRLTFQHWSGLSPYTSSYELSRDLCF